MPDFGRWTSNGGDPSLNEINRTDRFLDALAFDQQVYSTDAGEAELANLLSGWRDDVRDTPVSAVVTPRDAVMALDSAQRSRRRTRTLALVGSVAATVLCLGGFVSVVAGAGPGDTLYGLHTMIFGQQEKTSDTSVMLASQQLAEVQQLIDQGQWQAAQDKLQTLTTTVATVNDVEQKQDLVSQWQQLTVKVESQDANATPAPGAPLPQMPDVPAVVTPGSDTSTTTTSSASSDTSSPTSPTSPISETSPTSPTSPTTGPSTPPSSDNPTTNPTTTPSPVTTTPPSSQPGSTSASAPPVSTTVITTTAPRVVTTTQAPPASNPPVQQPPPVTTATVVPTAAPEPQTATPPPSPRATQAPAPAPAPAPVVTPSPAPQQQAPQQEKPAPQQQAPQQEQPKPPVTTTIEVPAAGGGPR